MTPNKHYNSYKEGLDLEYFDTQSNYVDYLWEVLYRTRDEVCIGYCHNNLIRFIPTS